MGQVTIRRLRQGALTASVAMFWLALSGFSWAEVAIHRQQALPFGGASLCGGQPHCVWCSVAVVSAALALATVFGLPALLPQLQKIRAR